MNHTIGLFRGTGACDRYPLSPMVQAHRAGSRVLLLLALVHDLHVPSQEPLSFIFVTHTCGVLLLITVYVCGVMCDVMYCMGCRYGVMYCVLCILCSVCVHLCVVICRDILRYVCSVCVMCVLCVCYVCVMCVLCV